MKILKQRAFLAFVVLSFTYLISERILFVIFPNYLINRSFSPSQIGLIFSIAAIILLISRFFIGKISDILGRKMIMSIGLTLESVAITAYTFVSSLFSFSIIRGIQEIGMTLAGTVEGALIGDLFPKKIRAKVISKLGAVYAVARVFAVIIGFIAVTYLSIIHGFYIAATAVFISMIVFYFLIDEPKRVQQQFSFFPSFKKYSKTLYKLSTAGFLQELAFGIAFAPAFFILARSLGISEGNLFLYLLFSYIINGFILYFLQKKKENLGTKKLYLYSLLLYSFAISLYAIASSGLHILLILPVVTFAFYIWRIGFARFLIDSANPKTRGEQIGFATAFMGIGGVIGPAIGGFTVEFVSLSLAFVLSGIAIFLAAMIVRTVIEK